MGELARKAILGLTQTALLLGLCLFASAGTWSFWQAWVFIGVFVLTTTAITAYLWKWDRALLTRRVGARPGAETDAVQKWIHAILTGMAVCSLVIPGLDRRFGWSNVPVTAVWAGDVFVAVGLWIVFTAYRANSFAAATVEVFEGQRVISSGPYAIVRHPMYSGALVVFGAMPLALGSWWAGLVLAPLVATIAWRLLREEMYLRAHLSGYREYCRSVRSRLVPYIW
jgi:protein-S-isoprenylcysteine O-methyltransferase Ste14